LPPHRQTSCRQRRADTRWGITSYFYSPDSRQHQRRAHYFALLFPSVYLPCRSFWPGGRYPDSHCRSRTVIPRGDLSFCSIYYGNVQFGASLSSTISIEVTNTLQTHNGFARTPSDPSQSFQIPSGDHLASDWTIGQGLYCYIVFSLRLPVPRVCSFHNFTLLVGAQPVALNYIYSCLPREASDRREGPPSYCCLICTICYLFYNHLASGIDVYPCEG